MPIYAYRVIAGQERIVMEMLSKRVKSENLPIYAIIHFEDMKGYMIVEAENEMAVRNAGMKIPHIKGVLDRPLELKDLEPMLVAAAKPMSQVVQKNDIVELISGPFKGERARVIRIDDNKDELTVELTEVAVPIPVTIKANTIRLRQRAEENSEENKKE
jgi:transcriptional antiterminator NusG